jgi:hypothetical protein
MTTEQKDELLSILLDVPTPLKDVRLKSPTRLKELLCSIRLIEPTFQQLEIRNTSIATNYRLTAIANTLKVYEEEVKKAGPSRMTTEQHRYRNQLTNRYILTGNKAIDDQLTKYNSTGNKDFLGFVKDMSDLERFKLPSDLDSLQRLLDEGKLDAGTATIVTNLIESGKAKKDLNPESSPRLNPVEFVRYNTYLMAAYVATAVHNRNEPAPAYLIHAIATQFSNQELQAAIREIYRRLDVMPIINILGIKQNKNNHHHPPGSKSPWGIIGSIMKYWRISTIKEAMDQDYLNAMALNACIPSYESKDDTNGGSGETMDFFEFGKQLAGIK